MKPSISVYVFHLWGSCGYATRRIVDLPREEVRSWSIDGSGEADLKEDGGTDRPTPL